MTANTTSSDPGPQTPLLASNVLYMTATVVTSSLALFLIDLVIIRHYGRTLHGDLMWVLALGRTILLLGDLGLTGAASVRRTARQRAAGETGAICRSLSAVASLSFLLAALLAAALFLLAGPMADLREGEGASALWLRIAAVWILLQAGIRICRMIVIGFERLGDILFMTPVDEGGKFLWLIVCLVCELDVLWLLVGWTGTQLLTLAIAAWRTRRLTREFSIRLRPLWIPVGESLRLVGRSVPYFVPSLWMAGLPFFLSLLVGLWHSGDEVSLLKVCLSWALVSRLLVSPIASAMLPRAAWADAAGEAHFRQVAASQDQATRMLGLVGSLGFALLWWLGKPLLSHLYGAGYADGSAVLLVLAVGIGLDNYCCVLDQILLATRYVRTVVVLEGLKYAVLIGCVLWLAPSQGAAGAAWAMCAAVGVALAGRLLVLRKEIMQLGGASLAATAGVFALLIGAGLLSGRPWTVPAAWLAAVLVLRLLRPTEVLLWLRTVLRILGSRRS